MMFADEKKIRVLFVCHGNICRSPMAEFVMKKLVDDAGLSDRFFIDSCAVSTEEIGNDIYPPAKRKLSEKGIPFEHHYARQITKQDYAENDYIVCMDESNLRWLRRIIGDDAAGKVSLLMQWCEQDRGGADPHKKGIVPRSSVADPWYTGDFEATYQDIIAGCTVILDKLK